MAENERERIARLETQMKGILGNGQPGRLDDLERDVRAHRTWLLLAMGGLYVIQFAAANGWLTFTAQHAAK